MQPSTRQCPVEGCTSTNTLHITAALTALEKPNHDGPKVHKAGGEWLFQCGVRSDGFRCLRLEPDTGRHDGPHVFPADPTPPPAYEVDEVEVVFDGRNKPTFQHLLNKRKEQS